MRAKEDHKRQRRMSHNDESIYQNDITIKNTSNNRTPKYLKQISTELKGEIGRTVIRAGNSISHVQ